MEKILDRQMLHQFLIENSSDTEKIRSNQFFEHFAHYDENLHNFRRRLAIVMRELQIHEFSKAELGSNFDFICGTNEGFHITNCTKSQAAGIRFYIKKTGRKGLYSAMIAGFKKKLFFKKIKEEPIINENEQYEMKLVS